jgi:hypothetical protein
MANESPVDFSSGVGRVRKYIPDLIELPDPQDLTGPKSYIFSDEELESFINDETLDGVLPETSWRIRRAAAWAMIALANSENLILKKITTQDQQTDGPAVARALLQAADALFAHAAREEVAANETELFIHVPFNHGVNSSGRWVTYPVVL